MDLATNMFQKFIELPFGNLILSMSIDQQILKFVLIFKGLYLNIQDFQNTRFVADNFQLFKFFLGRDHFSMKFTVNIAKISTFTP